MLQNGAFALPVAVASLILTSASSLTVLVKQGDVFATPFGSVTAGRFSNLGVAPDGAWSVEIYGAVDGAIPGAPLRQLSNVGGFDQRSFRGVSVSRAGVLYAAGETTDFGTDQ